jgi:hypothetical protein
VAFSSWPLLYNHNDCAGPSTARVHAAMSQLLYRGFLKERLRLSFRIRSRMLQGFQSLVELAEQNDGLWRTDQIPQSLRSSSTFLDVLVVHWALLDTRAEWVQSNTEVSLRAIRLYKALGGGWEQAVNPDDP